VVQQYLATGPDDEDATVNHGSKVGPAKYALSRDLAIYELRYPIPRHQGVGFSLKDLQMGQEVDIYGFPKEGINPVRKLVQFHGTFKGETTAGLLSFDYSLDGNKGLKPGVSGGIVVDSRTQQIVGVLSGLELYGKPIALAVSVQSLADFVCKVDPFLAQTLFPVKIIPPISADLYPKFVAPHVNTLQQRPEESEEVKALRANAQFLAEGMRNFIAVQTFAWGRGGNPPSAEAEYEVQVVDGHQRFREYPSGSKEFSESGPLPALNTGISTGGEWADLPAFVATEMGLKIRQAPEAVVNSRRVKVFQYQADPEDQACQFLHILDFILFKIKKTETVECYGEAWTDENMNILRMSEHLELRGSWKNYQGEVTYGWLRMEDGTSYLLPLTISVRAEFKRKIYWCRGQFKNYRVFATRTEMKVAAN
jgi:hypothetical protein